MTTSSPGTDALDALYGGRGPTDAEVAAAGGYANNPATTADTLYVPWFGFSMPRAKDIKKVPTNPTQADQRERMLQNAAPDLYGQAAPLPPMTGFDASDVGNPEAVPHEIPQQEPSLLQDANKVALDPYNWTNDEVRSVAGRMVDVGMIDENYTMKDVVDAWGQLVKDAAVYHQARPNDLYTPLDMLELNYGDGSKIGGGTGNKTQQVVSKSVSVSTNEQARSLLRETLAQKLGRRPTQVEIDDFQAALNDAQRANPQITTTTSMYNKAGRMTNSNSETTGGLDDRAFADDITDWRNPDSEYGRYQAATTYYNALLGAIRGPVG